MSSEKLDISYGKINSILRFCQCLNSIYISVTLTFPSAIPKLSTTYPRIINTLIRSTSPLAFIEVEVEGTPPPPPSPTLKTVE